MWGLSGRVFDAFWAIKKSDQRMRCDNHWGTKAGKGGRRKSNRLQVSRMARLRNRAKRKK